MFDSATDGELATAMAAEARAESAATARRLAAVGELYARRAVEWADRQLWCADPCEAVAAEVSAAQNISRGRARSQIDNARALRERLPKVAAVFAEGAIDFRMVATIIARTGNVDDAAVGGLDAALAATAAGWMKYSGPKLADRIDAFIARFDADGVRVPPTIEKGRYVEVGPTVPGMGGIWANVHAADAAAFDARLDALAATVCKDDPRTTSQRRADAVGALAAGADRMVCGCRSGHCPMLGAGGAPAVVIHVLAEAATVAGTADAPAYLRGFGIQPAQSVRDLADRACVKPVAVPVGRRAAGYRFPAAIAEFIAWRDLTCRWPGCDGRVCDIDHTIPWPGGPTQASNGKQYCRVHHLIKTFYTGSNGWSDRQSEDGTITFTSPAGQSYRTEPFGAALFPALGVPTGPVAAPADAPPSPGRGLAMPTRRRTRDQDRSARIERERRGRAEINAAEARDKARRQARINAANPPPF